VFKPTGRPGPSRVSCYLEGLRTADVLITVGLRIDSVELSAHSFRAHSRAYLRDTDNGYRHSQMVQRHKRIRLHSA